MKVGAAVSATNRACLQGTHLPFEQPRGHHRNQK
jgi:hypothetical protein